MLQNIPNVAFTNTENSLLRVIKKLFCDNLKFGSLTAKKKVK